MKLCYCALFFWHSSAWLNWLLIICSMMKYNFVGLWYLQLPTGQVWQLEACCREHGQASSWFDHVQETARNCHRTTLREMWWQVCRLWFLRPPMHACTRVWWVQLWFFSGPLRHLWGSGNLWCLLLQRVHAAGEGQGWVSKNRQSRKC